MKRLKSLDCPECGATIPEVEVEAVRTSSSFETCLRRCEPCGAGFSNGATNPTAIYADPTRNVPAEVREDALTVLADALNAQNRTNKRKKFGFSTSEDAVTWTVFNGLREFSVSQQAEFYGRVLGLEVPAPPTVLLWGVPLEAESISAADVREKLVAVSNALKENPASRSEPDVVIDFGDEGVAFIEVKYQAPNEVAADKPFAGYVDSDAFADSAAAESSQLYELVRNWRIGWDLADGRPFVLANLGLPKLFKDRNGLLQRFEDSLNTGPGCSFARLTWPDWTRALRASGPLPEWLDAYIEKKGLA